MVNVGTLLLLAAITCMIVSALFNVVYKSNILAAKTAYILLVLSFLCITCTLLMMVNYFLNDNFSFSYVYNHSSKNLQTAYKISALWSGQEGSLLLWSFISVCICFLNTQRWRNALSVEKTNLVAYKLICILIMILTYISRPFVMINIIRIDGLGLNLALQDPWMVIHPPLVFIAYSSMGVLFSMCFSPHGSGLEHRRKYAFRWVLISWLFLSAGIVSGSVWAYRALGWGGYWAWDPIENAALIPWLLLAVIVHKRDAQLQNSKISYMLPFISAVFGTYLARSGILEKVSVHSYASSSLHYPLVLMLIACIIVTIYGLKNREHSTKVTNDIAFGIIVRMLIYIFTLFILVGTTWPIFAGSAISINIFSYGSLAFAMLLTLLFILQDFKLITKNVYKIMLLDTILVSSLVVIINAYNTVWIILIWFLMIPLINWILSFKKFKNISACISHMGVMLLIVGAITSSNLSDRGFIMADLFDKEYIEVFDNKISYQKLYKDKSIIIHKPTEDIVIEFLDSNALNKIYIKYTTKPFIILFWAGSTMLIFGNILALIKGVRHPSPPPKKEY